MHWYALSAPHLAQQLRDRVVSDDCSASACVAAKGSRASPYGMVLNWQGSVIDSEALSVITYAVAHGSEEYAPIVVEEWDNSAIWRPLAKSPMQSYGSATQPVNHTHI